MPGDVKLVMIMSENEVSKALQKIARGTGIVFVGTIVSMLLRFLSRTIIARHFSTSEYGVFNLALTILDIALVVATLGFRSSLPREIVLYKEKEPSRVEELISTVLVTVAVSSFAIMIFLIFSSDFIAHVFNEKRLVYSLKVVAFALPFSALISLIISISQGFGRVRERVYFQNVVYPILWLVSVLILAVLNLSFAYIFWAYFLAQALTFFALVLDVWRIKLFELKLSFDLKIGKKIIMFSLPLLISGILAFVMNWTDTLMLGYYSGSESVGIYNAATPLARLIPVFLNSAAFLYPTIVSQLYAQGKIKEISRVYQVLTKWIFFLTLPIFTMMFLFPKATIGLFFGNRYVSAVPALQILALGFMFHTLFGPNWLSLVIIGENNFVLMSNSISALLNVLLNALLIPSHGIVGAAIATAVSYLIANLLNSAKLYKETKIHPFSWSYMKSLFISFVLLGLIKNLHLRVPNIWYAVPVLVAFLIVYFSLVLVSKSIEKEDVELLLTIETRLGIDLWVIKKILRRFF